MQGGAYREREEADCTQKPDNGIEKGQNDCLHHPIANVNVGIQHLPWLLSTPSVGEK